jgi:stringent starvation protein B
VTQRFPTADERDKRQRLDALLADALVYVHVDARDERVQVPEHLKGEAALVLKLSHRFGLETFDVGPVEVVASLSFGGDRFRCVLPYAAVFAYSTDEQPFVAFFPESAPAELTEAIASVRSESEVPPEPDAEVEGAPPPGPPTLRLVE